MVKIWMPQTVQVVFFQRTSEGLFFTVPYPILQSTLKQMIELSILPVIDYFTNSSQTNLLSFCSNLPNFRRLGLFTTFAVTSSLEESHLFTLIFYRQMTSN